jgi:hypothetical protein
LVIARSWIYRTTSDITVLCPQTVNLQSGDPKLQDLHQYALHLPREEDPAQMAHNASLLFLTVVNTFQHTGITDLDWVPSLYIEVDSKECEVSRRGLSKWFRMEKRLEPG